MKRIKHTVCIMLALTVLWGLLPAGFNPLEVTVKATWNSSDASPTISTAQDWVSFANTLFGGDMSGKTVRLNADIDLTTLPSIPSVNSFFSNFTFDGQNHKITIGGGKEFKGNSGNYGVGLFGTMDGTVKNVVVKVKGTMHYFEGGVGFDTDKYLGSLVGYLNGTVENCAVIGESDDAIVQFVRDDHYLFPNQTALGGLVGYAKDSATIRNCYSDVNLKFLDGVALSLLEHTTDASHFWEILDPYFEKQKNHAVGGIVGRVEGASVIVENCAYYNGKLEGNFPEADINETSPHTGSVDYSKPNLLNIGGIAGSVYSGTISRCIASGLELNGASNLDWSIVTEEDIEAWRKSRGKNHLESGPSWGVGGGIAGYAHAGATVRNCYTSAVKTVQCFGYGKYGSSPIPNASGLNTVSGSTGETVWTDTMAGTPNLSWLLQSTSDPTSVTVDAKSNPPTLTVEPAAPQGPTSGSVWTADITFPVKSPMPTPVNPMIAPVLSTKGIHRVTALYGATDFEAGGKYAFQAEVAGYSAEEEVKDKITWSVKPVGSGTISANAISSDGVLSIPTGFAGQLVVTATLKDGEITSAKSTDTLQVTSGDQEVQALLSNSGDSASSASISLLPGQKAVLKVRKPDLPEPGTWRSPQWPNASYGTLTGTGELERTYTASAAAGNETLEVKAVYQPDEPKDSGNYDYQAAFSVTVKAVPSPEAKPVLIVNTADSYTVKFDTPLTLPENPSLDLRGLYRYRKGEDTTEISYNAQSGIPLTKDADFKLTFWSMENDYRFKSKEVVYTITWPPAGVPTLTCDPATPEDTAEGVVSAGQTRTFTKPYTKNYPEGPSIATSMNLKTVLDDAAVPEADKALASGGHYVLAAGQISAKVYYAGEDSLAWGTIRGKNANLFRRGTGGEDIGGETASMPTIHPGYNEALDIDMGITIQAALETGDKIMYVTHQTTTESGYLGMNSPPDGFQEYAQDKKPIAFPADANVRHFEVWAYTKAAGGRKDSGMAYRRYSRSGTDLPQPDPPALSLQTDSGTAPYNASSSYDPSSKIVLTHAYEGKIKYRFGTSVTAPWIDYSADNPPVLPGGSLQVTLQAYFIYSAYGLESEVASFSIQISPLLEAPTADPASGSTVKSGDELIFTLSDNTLRMLDENHGGSGAIMHRVYYDEAGLHGWENGQAAALPAGLIPDEAPANAGYQVSVAPGYGPQTNTRYLSARVSESYQMPEIHYSIGANEDAGVNSPTYAYGIRRVTLTGLTTDTQIPVYEVRYSKPDRLELTAADGESTITVKAMTQTGTNDAASSASRTYTYNVLAKAEAPTAKPATDYDNPTVLRPDERVKLSSRTVGAKIYYTDDDTEPGLDALGNPIGTTRLYEASTGIAMKSSAYTFLTIRAFATAPGFDRSDTVLLRYQLPTAEAPTAFPSTTSDNPAVVRPDEVIRLTSKISGAKIFYTLDNSTPSVDQNGNALGAGTLLYNDTNGIPMDKAVSTFMTIRAVTWANGYDLSETATFIYQLPARVQPVLATPNGGDVVEATRVTLATTTTGAVIYYTTDNTAPNPQKSQLYSGPITIDDDMTIRAVAELNGMQSLETTYKFYVADRLKTPKASLGSGSMVYKGTSIRLRGEESIAYTVDGSDPTAILKSDASSSSSGGSGGTNITITTNDKEDEDQVLYGKNVVIDADFGESVTVRAFSYGNGYTPSKVASFTYTVCEKDAYLTAVPESGGTVRPGDQITLTTGITDGKIFYTVNGGAPDVYNRYYDDDDDDDDSGTYRWSSGSRTQRGNIVQVEGDPGSAFTIRATAVQNGAEGGTTVVFSYKIAERTPAPTASIPSGAITLDGAQVALTVSEGDIFYTTDGADPTTSSTLYTGPIPVTGSMVLKAVALADGKEPSEIVQYVYTRAGETAAPVMNVPGGEIEQGTRVELTTSTQGATIYYTTDGAEPGDQSMTYTAPITIMRPVTLKAKAVMTGLHDSVVNSATYTVYEPVTAEDESEEEKLQRLETDRLATRRTYSDEAAGPTFSDVMLVDAQHNVVLSAPQGNAPADAQLVIRQVEPNVKEKQAVTTQTGYTIVCAYDVTLERGGEEVQPSGEVELGLPIPADYQNGIVLICRLGDDGTIETFETRRSGGIAYVMRDHLSRYAVIVPQAVVTMGGGARLPWTAGGVAALAGAAVVILAALYHRKKKQSGG